MGVSEGAAESGSRVIVALIPGDIGGHIDAVVMHTHAIGVVQKTRVNHPLKIGVIIHVQITVRVIRIGIGDAGGRKRAADDNDIRVAALDGLVSQTQHLHVTLRVKPLGSIPLAVQVFSRIHSTQEKILNLPFELEN